MNNNPFIAPTTTNNSSFSTLQSAAFNLEQQQEFTPFNNNNNEEFLAGLKKRECKYYALRIASIPGIYRNWTEASSLINGCPGAKYKSFYTLEESMQYIREGFPDAQFKMEGENYLLVNPEPIFKVNLIFKLGY